MNYFKEVVTTEEELRTLLGEPSELVRNKVISYIDDHCRMFIRRSPLLFLATADSLGRCDVSPRGDGPGFVHILDESHLVIPERPGNRRVDSMRNILSTPQVGLVFVIPQLGETLRVNGKACIIKDQEILRKLSVNDKAPLLGIGVEVEECFIHCAKAFKRSRLWEHDTWPNRETLPSPAKILTDHANIPGTTAVEVAKLLQESYTKRLY
ncbi:pyridoxamine 5'-phosphate oxidase family protein [Ammoniphilus sp. CFH 90114]|uniref:pyridoxamine 5'-phosphate oxidase family protein n=1 Tax=Ammoniphilus sp. CFH 90114 TaxID=2493665 RepID=UPI00100ECCEB|nr:pyridoxamine 5'-phosphate oxidase family protein [Ammoniphilus sp. CFH 90114]RXT03608.1 pyridoxamine 5'-phosphate oxidase family protein [Ammoniphilus sp. CFH 90114]